MAYSKLHSSIVNSSLWTEPDAVRILFITLLAACDKEGVVYGSRNGLSRLANINADDEDDAWDALLSPDQDSSDKLRCPENEGRRIEEVPGGFRLLNFAYYRGLRDDDDRRKQNREAQARFRSKSSKVSRSKPQSAKNKPISEAEAEAEKEAVSSLSPSEVVLRSKELDRVAARMKEIQNSYDTHQTWAENDRKEFGTLKARRSELKKMLGVTA